jgi:cold shock CspA family protein
MLANTMNEMPTKISDTVNAWETGSIKFFDPVRRWGFIVPDEGFEDIFFPWTTLQESGIRESQARIGVRVMYVAKAPDHPGQRFKALRIRLIR